MPQEDNEAAELKHAEEIGFVIFPAADQSAKVVKPGEQALSGKGLARHLLSVRFQPLPIRTAREVFLQAAHPVGFIKRVMRRVGWLRLSLHVLHPRQWLELPAPVQPEYTVEVFATPSSPSDTRLSSPFPSR